LLVSFFGWPLRRLLSYSLEHPHLLASGTRFLARHPLLFNWLLGFAQRNGIISNAEETDRAPAEIQSISELNPDARRIFDDLKAAFQRHSGSGRP
jgi:hypothetical protein